jgi:phage tail protein X
VPPIQATIEIEMPDISDANVKAEAVRLVNDLPESATWDDLMYRIYVRQCIDAGVADADANRVVSVEEVRRRFGLTP